MLGCVGLGVMETTEISVGDEVEVDTYTGGRAVVKVSNVDHCHGRIEGETVYSKEYVCSAEEDIVRVLGQI